jgi:hypothetical protein
MKITLIHFIVAIAVCIGVLVGYGFWYTILSKKSADVSALQTQIDTKTDAVARIASTQTALTEIIGDEDLLQSYFVPETGVVSFIDELEDRGRTLGASVDVLSVSTGGTAAQPILTFALSIRGTFDAIMRAVGAIEHAPYDLIVTKLVLGQEEKEGWQAQMNITVGSVPKTATTTKP